MKNIIIITLFIGFITHGFTQTGLTKAMENQTTKNQQTNETVNYTKQYQRYLERAERHSNTSTILLVTSSVISSMVIMNLPNEDIDRGRTLILVNGLFIGLSTTYTISARENRRKAYKLKKQSYL